MPTNGTPPPTWPIEPATLYVVAYYPNNALDTAPDFINLRMVSPEQAIQASKDKITLEGNVGVCVIYPAAVTIVFPSTPWEDF